MTMGEALWLLDYRLASLSSRSIQLADDAVNRPISEKSFNGHRTSPLFIVKSTQDSYISLCISYIKSKIFCLQMAFNP